MELKDGKQKRQNPLTDLVETEKTFVDQLTGIIRVCYPSLHQQRDSDTRMLYRKLPLLGPAQIYLLQNWIQCLGASRLFTGQIVLFIPSVNIIYLKIPYLHRS